MVARRQQLISHNKMLNGRKNACSYITIHETGNRGKGANASAHANLQSRGNVRSASWHWTVDDHEAVQSYTHDAQCWHGGSRAANDRSIAIEICVNSDGNYRQAVRNAASLVAMIIGQSGIPLSRIVQHNYWSGKNCPTGMREGRDGITFATFIQWVREAMADATPVVNTPAPPKPAGLTIDGYVGPDTVRAWQRIMGTPVDGVITGQHNSSRKYHVRLASVQYQGNGDSSLAKAVQRALGVAVDGYMGPGTIKAIQARLGVAQDGYFGPGTASALQKRLTTGKF